MAIKKLAERALEMFGDQRHLSSVSVTQIYRMWGSKTYLSNSLTLEKTRPRMAPIGKRRNPQPNGKPEYIRIDTVHQGDLGKVKGVCHINAVDEVTQMQVMVSVVGISEQFLMPVLEQLLDAFSSAVLVLALRVAVQS